MQVICADGADSHPAAAPYDKIIVTAGAWDIAPAWWDQLAPSGRLLIPLRLHGSDLTRTIAFDHVGPGEMQSRSVRVSGFVPMIGAIAHAPTPCPSPTASRSACPPTPLAKTPSNTSWTTPRPTSRPASSSATRSPSSTSTSGWPPTTPGSPASP